MVVSVQVEVLHVVVVLVRVVDDVSQLVVKIVVHDVGMVDVVQNVSKITVDDTVVEVVVVVASVSVSVSVSVSHSVS